MSEDLIAVTNWEKVEEADFYLSNDWLKDSMGYDDEQIKQIKDKSKNGELYIAYIVQAKNYAIYFQMDAHQIIVDEDFNEIVSCEGCVISNNHKKRIEWSY